MSGLFGENWSQKMVFYEEKGSKGRIILLSEDNIEAKMEAYQE